MVTVLYYYVMNIAVHTLLFQIFKNQSNLIQSGEKNRHTVK